MVPRSVRNMPLNFIDQDFAGHNKSRHGEENQPNEHRRGREHLRI